MSARIQQAVNQVRLTNVAVVRLKRGGKKFEIACYKNKVVNWRSGVEQDLSEVLQADGVYENVTRGNLAKRKDLINVFGTADYEKVCLQILKHGKLQVSSKERQVEIETMFKDIARIVTEKCINTHTKRPFTVSAIERAMKDTLHYAVKPSKSTKQQALSVVQMLKEHLPIERAQMKVQFTLPSKLLKALKKDMDKFKVTYTDEDFDGANCTVTCNIQPGAYRLLDDTLKKFKNYKNMYISEIDVLSMATTNEAEENVSTSGTNDLTQEFAKVDIHDSIEDNIGTLAFPMKSNSSNGKDFSDVVANFNDDVKNNRLEIFNASPVASISTANAGRLDVESVEESIANSRNDYSANRGGKKKKKKKNKRRNKNAEHHAMTEAIASEQDQSGVAVDQVVDLCGYTYESHRGGWLLRPPSESDIAAVSTLSNDGVRNVIDPAEELKRIRRNEKNSWCLFGAKERPGLWSQKLQGWMIHKKYEERLDILGAIKL